MQGRLRRTGDTKEIKIDRKKRLLYERCQNALLTVSNYPVWAISSFDQTAATTRTNFFPCGEFGVAAV